MTVLPCRKQHFIVLSLVMTFLVVAGCDTSGSEDGTGQVGVVLHHVVEGTPLALNAGHYVNEASNRYTVTLLEYIITNVALIREGGTRFALHAAHYSNAADEATHRLAPVEVPAGRYTGVAFTFGLEAAENVFGTMPNTAAYDNMAWPAQLGGGTDRYHYMRLEGRYERAANDMASFLVHTGPTGGADNSVALTLPFALEVEGGDWEVQVEMDVAEWFTQPNMYDFRAFEGMIMGNQVAQDQIKANATSVFTARVAASN